MDEGVDPEPDEVTVRTTLWSNLVIPGLILGFSIFAVVVLRHRFSAYEQRYFDESACSEFCFSGNDMVKIATTLGVIAIFISSAILFPIALFRKKSPTLLYVFSVVFGIAWVGAYAAASIALDHPMQLYKLIGA